MVIEGGERMAGHRLIVIREVHLQVFWLLFYLSFGFYTEWVVLDNVKRMHLINSGHPFYIAYLRFLEIE